MGRIEEARYHKVFPVEVVGNTLIVAPRGDAAGFRDSDVADELKTLEALADDPTHLHLIVDLASAQYFGSTIIGAITSLGRQVRDAGGRVALCNASAETLEMLRIMHLDEMWMNFDSRKIALKAMSK